MGAALGALLWAIGVRPRGRDGDRIGRVVAAGILGAAVGMAPVLAFIGAAFAGADTPSSTGTVLAIYAAGGVLAHIAALVAVHLVLRASGDPHTGSTVRTLSWVVPVGAALALGAGVGTAYLHGFSTTPSTWVLTVTSVLLVLAATFAAGRAIALPPGAARRRGRAGARRAE
ncbi:hypothetical protein FK268_03775 [Tsukamurella sputi]|uniref:Uncharacterized protein n=1 Tax=Tsukamurella sputi TaxID=2591848 RepID=A0A5C5RVZ1_9ACTN|nr:hypothetical protein [Tsukamurella sputi]TWS26365.1 hypothetical protein FK268_03775 [Tsukamurella sputi]